MSQHENRCCGADEVVESLFGRDGACIKPDGFQKLCTLGFMVSSFLYMGGSHSPPNGIKCKPPRGDAGQCKALQGFVADCRFRRVYVSTNITPIYSTDLSSRMHTRGFGKSGIRGFRDSSNEVRHSTSGQPQKGMVYQSEYMGVRGSMHKRPRRGAGFGRLCA